MSDDTYERIQEWRHADEVESLRVKIAELRLERDQLRLDLDCAHQRIRDLEAGR